MNSPISTCAVCLEDYDTEDLTDEMLCPKCEAELNTSISRHPAGKGKPPIQIIGDAPDEVRAWTRRIEMKFDGRAVRVKLHYDEGDGYEAGTPSFSEDWTAEQKSEFESWLRKQENLGHLDEITAFIKN